MSTTKRCGYFLLCCTLGLNAGTAQSNNEGASFFDFDYALIFSDRLAEQTPRFYASPYTLFDTERECVERMMTYLDRDFTLSKSSTGHLVIERGGIVTVTASCVPVLGKEPTE
jgi:hypothetical protein